MKIKASNHVVENLHNFQHVYNKPAPARTTLIHWKEKLLEHGSLVSDRPRTETPVSASGDDVKSGVLADVNEDPTTSTRRLSTEHAISQTTVCRILKNVGMHP